MVGGSFRVLRLLPPLKFGRYDIAEILLKVGLKHPKQIKEKLGVLKEYPIIQNILL
jgi:hypothetical protein